MSGSAAATDMAMASPGSTGSQLTPPLGAGIKVGVAVCEAAGLKAATVAALKRLGELFRFGDSEWIAMGFPLTLMFIGQLKQTFVSASTLCGLCIVSMYCPSNLDRYGSNGCGCRSCSLFPCT